MSAEDLTRLFPHRGGAEDQVSAAQAYGELGLQAQEREDRPYVVVNMVSTVDGQGRLGGDTSELGNAADLKLFVQLREQVDCVMAGVRTVAIERYKGPGGKEATRHKRELRGLAPRPLFATATRSGELPVDTPLFQDLGAEIVVFSTADLQTEGARAKITRVDTEDPHEMLRALRHDFNVRSVLLEGGPHINTPFFAAELIDELFLTMAPILIGGGEPFPIIAGDLPRVQQLHLIGALLNEEHLFLRYRVD
jgi:5-amino-6-(5-phosphoribosylamino)uracil reductase